MDLSSTDFPAVLLKRHLVGGWHFNGPPTLSPLSSSELPKKKERKERRKLCNITCHGRPQGAFLDNNYWSISLISEEGGFRSGRVGSQDPFFWSQLLLKLKEVNGAIQHFYAAEKNNRIQKMDCVNRA